MAIKVAAWEMGKSMNQAVVDVITEALSQHEAREKAIKLPAGYSVQPTLVSDSEKRPVYAQPVQFHDGASGFTFEAKKALCKIHGTPLDSRGKCLQKGCKYA